MIDKKLKMLVVVTSIPGVGGTTVTNKAIEKLKGEGINYETINYGNVMVEIAESEGLVKKRDEMRRMSPNNQKKVQKAAAKKIREASLGKNIILDTHCTISTPKGYLPGLPEWVLRELSPGRFVIVEADAEEIAMRRAGDKSRERDTESSENIRNHQDMNRNIASAYSLITGMTVKIIQNPQGKVDDAANEMVEILK